VTAIAIRPAEPCDAAQLVDLLLETFWDTWAPQMSQRNIEKFLAREDGPAKYVSDKLEAFLVAVAEDGVAGMIHWHDGFVHALHVRAAYRRKGIAAALMACAEKATKEAGFKSLRLETDTFNAPSQALYRHLGYAEIARYPDVLYDPSIVTVLLEKQF
jgi:ribosomal protein S18 acetylase RimI-like enzyme